MDVRPKGPSRIGSDARDPVIAQEAIGPIREPGRVPRFTEKSGSFLDRTEERAGSSLLKGKTRRELNQQRSKFVA
jgi:hypothetical protein